MSEPSVLSVAQRDRREERRCPEGATERCERDCLRLAPCVGNSNAIPPESLSLCEAMDLTTGHRCGSPILRRASAAAAPAHNSSFAWHQGCLRLQKGAWRTIGHEQKAFRIPLPRIF